RVRQVGRVAGGVGRVQGGVARPVRGRVPAEAERAVRRADVCAVAIAEGFRGDGETVANPIGAIPRIGGRLARLAFEPDLVMTDNEAMLVTDPEGVVEAWNPYRSMFDVVWSGR